MWKRIGKRIPLRIAARFSFQVENVPWFEGGGGGKDRMGWDGIVKVGERCEMRKGHAKDCKLVGEADHP